MSFPPRPIRLHKAVYWFTALAFVLRIVARLHSGIDDFWVNSYYFFFELAQSIAAGKGITGPDGVATAFRVPFYPILLAGLTLGHKAFWPVLIAQSLIGAATAFLAAVLAQQMFGKLHGARAATISAGIVAVYPYYVIHDTALQETSLFTLLTLAAVIVVRQTARTGKLRSAILGGVLLGLDVLTRATIMPFAALVPLWLMSRKRIKAGLLCALLSAMTVSPWLWRNYMLTGSPVLSSESGCELWAGNNGYLFSFYPKQSSDLSKNEALNALTAADQRELEQIGNNEVLRDRWFLRKGLDYMRTHPRQTFIDGLRKIEAGFFLLPSPRHNQFDNLIYALSYGPTMLAGLWGMWQRRPNWREDLLIYALFGTFVLTTAVFWAHTSHRVYLDVYWIVFGAGALTSLRRKQIGTTD